MNKKISLSIFKKIILYLLITTFVLCLCVLGLIYVINKRSLPPMDGVLKVPELSKPVKFYRDKLGIPTIQAHNESDLFFTAGYAQSTDRRWQMETYRLIPQGRFSEVLGREMLEVDTFMRNLNFKKVVKHMLSDASKEHIAALQSYADGVNYYTTNHPLPFQFKFLFHTPSKWTVEDSLYCALFTYFTLSYNHFDELGFLRLLKKIDIKNLAYLFPTYDDEPLPFDEIRHLKNISLTEIEKSIQNIPEIEKWRNFLPVSIPASNNWVIHPEKTKHKKAILANDPHLFFLYPSTFYIMNLISPTYHVAGAMPVGTPLVSVGYNGDIAWGATMVMADTQDIYLEKTKEKNGNLFYLYKKKWVEAKKHKEEIKIKNNESHTFIFYETIHGPIINDSVIAKKTTPLQPYSVSAKYKLALKWSLHDGDTTLAGMYKLGKAKTMKQFKKALPLINGIYLNMVYTDGDNIAWGFTGNVPIRKNHTGKFPVPGWSGKYDWQGYINSATQKPSLYNPKKKFLATANNKYTDDILKKIPTSITSVWHVPERLGAINNYLENATDMTKEDSVNLQLSTKSLLAKKVIHLIFQKLLLDQVKIIKEPKKQQKIEEALSILKNFNFQMDAKSREAVLYGMFLHRFTVNVFYDELQDDWELFSQINFRSYSASHDHLLKQETSPFFNNKNTTTQESKVDILIQSLYEAIQHCEDRFGENNKDWEWGKLHTYTYKNILTYNLPILGFLLNRGPFPGAGSGHTVNVSIFHWEHDTFDTQVAPDMRFIMDFSNQNTLYMAGNAGQSENFLSPHYDDMIPYFLENQLHGIQFDIKDTNLYIHALELTP